MRNILLFCAFLTLASSGNADYNVSLDDSDPQILYSGEWEIIQDTLSFDGSNHGTTTIGSSAQLDFTGTLHEHSAFFRTTF